MLPRQLEIIYEISRRFLDDVRAKLPGDEGRIARVSLIEEGAHRQVRMAQLHFGITDDRAVAGRPRSQADAILAPPEHTIGSDRTGWAFAAGATEAASTHPVIPPPRLEWGARSGAWWNTGHSCGNDSFVKE